MAENGNSSSGVPVFFLPATPPFFVDEEAAVFSLVFTAHSLNYSMCFWLHHGWQESLWTAAKGFWKPAARLAEVKQCYPPLTLLALLSAKCLSPFPDGSWSSGKYFPSEFVALLTGILRQKVILVDLKSSGTSCP